ncbi:MAG TPA: GNAT family N-acetyltransferase [Rhizomicrobium sp.]|nr:GNAT family N-acetyltransferase [Rhizomicrobium sp.]
MSAVSQSHDVLVRPATVADRDIIAHFARAFHAEDKHPLSEQGVAGLLGMLEPGFADGVVLLLELDGVPAGYGVLSFCYGFEYGGPETFVEDIYVLPARRGFGFGQRLLSALEGAARATGRRAIHLEVMPGNRAEDWYRRQGWRSRGSQLLTKPI